MAALMARASTDGLGDAARAAPRPPPRSSFPWRRDNVRSPLSLMRSGRAVSMARTSTGCVCVVARAAPHLRASAVSASPPADGVCVLLRRLGGFEYAAFQRNVWNIHIIISCSFPDKILVISPSFSTIICLW